MSGLNEHHKRKILASIQYADKLLEESLQGSEEVQPFCFSEYFQDLAPAELMQVKTHIKDIRKKFAKLMEKCGIELEPPRFRRSWKIRANLISLDIALEDIYPKRLVGYGDLDPEAAKELTAAIDAIRDSVRRLVAFLSETQDN